jgi:hypothetical protein
MLLFIAQSNLLRKEQKQALAALTDEADLSLNVLVH